MIDWKLTKQWLNRENLIGVRPKVAVRCDKCGGTSVIAIRRKSKVIDDQMPWECNKCIANRPEKRAKSVEGALEAWQDASYREAVRVNSVRIWEDDSRRKLMSTFRDSPDFKDRMREINIKKVTPQFKDKMSSIMKTRWAGELYRNRMLKIISSTSKSSWAKPEYRERLRSIISKRWQDAQYREMMVNLSIENWNDPAYRAKMDDIHQSEEYHQTMSTVRRDMWKNEAYRTKMLAKLSEIRAFANKVSKPQERVYNILSSLSIQYYREYNGQPDDSPCRFGGFNWDCVIPRPGKPTLVIEVNGDYWHTRPDKIASDKRKREFITLNNDQYELRYIWEHELDSEYRVANSIRYWLGLQQESAKQIDFKLLEIRETHQYKDFLNRHHYLGSSRAGVVYGVYIGELLIGVCMFSPPIRQNVATNGLDKSMVVELSRLCIHPEYQVKNLASWFVSRCIKCLPASIKMVVSYCDTSFNHNGAIYKACNFVRDRMIDNDYWYAKPDVPYINKRSIYRAAKSINMREAEFVAFHGYTKVHGKGKLRFIYRR